MQLFRDEKKYHSKRTTVYRSSGQKPSFKRENSSTMRTPSEREKVP